MCFVLYVGTSKPLPRREWDKNIPSISVRPLQDREKTVRSKFQNPAVQYVGSTSGCGCDFPHAILQNGNYLHPSETIDQGRMGVEGENRKAFVDLLSGSGESQVELYGLWDGDFSERIEASEEISVAQIRNPGFYFKERGFYRVKIDESVSTENS